MVHFFGTIWPYLVAILLFLVMIVIHEFGHFLAAKLMGVRVNEFSVGFGPTLFKKQGKETLYDPARRTVRRILRHGGRG